MKYAQLFKETGILIIKNFIDEQLATELYQYSLENISENVQSDKQVPGSPAFYHEKKMAILHQQLLSSMEKYTELLLWPTYCYYRTYRSGAILAKHKDRPACEISASINLGQQGAAWALCCLDYQENTHRVLLNPGDALIYRGCDLLHWREPLIHADFVSQIFIHYVNKNGPNASEYKQELHNRLASKLQERSTELVWIRNNC